MAQVVRPKDATFLNGLMVRLGASAVADFDTRPPSDFGAVPGDEWRMRAAQTRAALIQKHVEPFGGYRMLLDGPNEDQIAHEIVIRQRPLLTVGLVLIFLRQIATFHSDVGRGASLYKAMRIALLNAVDPLPSISKIKAAWAEYRSVAHLCAAMTLMIAAAKGHPEPDRSTWLNAIKDHYPFFEGIGETLAHAREWQEWGLSFQLKNKGTRTSDALLHDVLRVPDNLRLPTVHQFLKPLPPDIALQLEQPRR